MGGFPPNRGGISERGICVIPGLQLRPVFLRAIPDFTAHKSRYQRVPTSRQNGYKFKRNQFLPVVHQAACISMFIESTTT